MARLAGEGAPAEIKGLAEVQVLKTVWAQQFREAQGKIVYQAGSRNDGHTQIQPRTIRKPGTAGSGSRNGLGVKSK